MTYAAAVTQLKTLTFTGLANSFEAVNMAPSGADLPALLIEDVTQPFTEGLKPINVQATKTEMILYIDHLLAIENINNGTIESRKANISLYLQRYTAAISLDMFLDGNLAVPLQFFVINRGDVFVRNRMYSGIKFRHKWEIRV